MLRPWFFRERHWMGDSFSDFIERLPREMVQQQLYMFSRSFDIDEAIASVASCSHVMVMEEFAKGLEQLNIKLGLRLPNVAGSDGRRRCSSRPSPSWRPCGRWATAEHDSFAGPGPDDNATHAASVSEHGRPLKALSIRGLPGPDLHHDVPALAYLRRYLPHFARFCSDDPRFRFSSPSTETRPTPGGSAISGRCRCSTPISARVWGSSKNRVLERFPDFDYYFFLEDDVELVDERVFPAHVELSRATGIHHFTLFQRGGIRQAHRASRRCRIRILHGLYGGGLRSSTPAQVSDRSADGICASPGTAAGVTRSTAIALFGPGWHRRRSMLPRIWPTPASGTRRRR